MKVPRTNDGLAEYMQKHGMVKTPAIFEAFRAVDRGDFATPSLAQVCPSLPTPPSPPALKPLALLLAVCTQ